MDQRNSEYSEYEASQEKYWSNLAKYQKNKISAVHWVDENDDPISEQMFLDVSDWILHRAGLPARGSQILEIGCGNGLMLDAMTKICRENGIKPMLFGTDISSDLLSNASSNYSLSMASAIRQPFQDSSFDLVYMHSVVQYFENIEYLDEVLAEIKRVMKPGGSLFIIDVLNSNMKEVIESSRPTSLKARIYTITPTPITKLYTRIRGKNQVRRNERIEVVGGISIPTPEFSGLYCAPEYFVEELSGHYAQVDIHLQTYKSKPLMYRKFRFNVVAQKAIK